MGDYDHYAAAAVRAGKTVPLSLTFFKPHPLANGEHPVIDVEHIGDSNEAYLNDSIARANAKIQIGEDGSKVSKKKLFEVLEKHRETITKYSVKAMRHVYKKGGVVAPEKDEKEIAAFIKSWASDIVLRVWNFVSNPENFRDPVIHGDAADIAEK